LRAVFERDFLSEASRPRAVILRTVVAVVVATAVLLLLDFGLRNSVYDPDRAGVKVFRAGASTLLIMLTIVTPPLVVGSILAERQQETLPLLLASPVGVRRFALAKLLSRWSLSLYVALAAFPCIALPVLFGGVSGSQVLDLGILTVALVLEVAAWSLWISSVSRRFATASVLALVLPPARWTVSGFAIGWILERDSTGALTDAARWTALLLCDTTPFGGVVEMMEPGAFAREFLGNRGTAPWPDFLVARPSLVYFAFAVATAAVAVFLAAERLKREAEPAESILVKTERRRRWFRGRPGIGNPIAWKERRLLNTASSRPLFYGVLGLMALTTLLGSEAFVHTETSIVVLIAEISLLSLVAAIQGAASLGHERDQGGWDLLRASLLSPADILRGKLAGLVLGISFLAAIPLCQILISLAMDGIEPRTAAMIAALLFLMPLSWGLVGFRVGVASARVRTAVVRVAAIFAGALVGLPCLAAVLMALDVSLDHVAVWVASGSPPAFLWQMLISVERLDFFRQQSMWFFGFAWGTLWSILALVLYIRLPVLVARRMDGERDTG
jgi:ABC-type transport system involved in multi-copper enzyme maturation permease subunit